MRRIECINSTDGDWVKVYIDGVFFEEGHSIIDNDMIARIFRELEIDYTETWERYSDDYTEE